jgi:hypothetical protein
MAWKNEIGFLTGVKAPVVIELIERDDTGVGAYINTGKLLFSPEGCRIGKWRPLTCFWPDVDGK